MKAGFHGAQAGLTFLPVSARRPLGIFLDSETNCMTTALENHVNFLVRVEESFLSKSTAQQQKIDKI